MTDEREAATDDPVPNYGDDPADLAEWPVELSGVTESIVTTLGPNGLWNAAALGLHAGDPVTARTWGNTRTRRNFHRRGTGYVQFVDDPVDFAEAALSIVEREEPVLASATAWVRVAVDRIESGREGDTDWEDWALRPLEATIERETVPTIDRGFGAVVEATVAASRLSVSGYDETELRDRLAYCASVVDRAGGPREREAIERVRERSSW
ncbi:DUF447 domain-containing protein [Natrinema altunense]|uniref:DUF447 family protein n=1 Tax=Natrinema altunense TaxID=222984 RepID=A0A482XZX6_9EURY|nr:DUF447 domain-containing protein [Natrinema altunense]RZH69369.1 DUF447 family protein [Natrinema altunense]